MCDIDADMGATGVIRTAQQSYAVRRLAAAAAASNLSGARQTGLGGMPEDFAC
jgi:hypothetical protein